MSLHRIHMPAVPDKMFRRIFNSEDSRSMTENAAADVHVMKLRHSLCQSFINRNIRSYTPSVINPVAAFNHRSCLLGGYQFLLVLFIVIHQLIPPLPYAFPFPFSGTALYDIFLTTYLYFTIFVTDVNYFPAIFFLRYCLSVSSPPPFSLYIRFCKKIARWLQITVCRVRPEGPPPRVTSHRSSLPDRPQPEQSSLTGLTGAACSPDSLRTERPDGGSEKMRQRKFSLCTVHFFRKRIY